MVGSSNAINIYYYYSFFFVVDIRLVIQARSVLFRIFCATTCCLKDLN